MPKKPKPAKAAPQDELAERRERNSLAAELAELDEPEWQECARQLRAGELSVEDVRAYEAASPAYYTAKLLGRPMPATVADYVRELRAGRDAAAIAADAYEAAEAEREANVVRPIRHDRFNGGDGNYALVSAVIPGEPEPEDAIQRMSRVLAERKAAQIRDAVAAGHLPPDTEVP